LRRKIRVNTKGCAAFVKIMILAPSQNPREGSGTVKSTVKLIKNNGPIALKGKILSKHQISENRRDD